MKTLNFRYLFVFLILAKDATGDEKTVSKFSEDSQTCRKGSASCLRRTFALPVSELKGALHIPIKPPGESLIPDFYNETLYKIGQDFSKKHLYSVIITPVGGQSMLTSSPLIRPLLLATGKVSNPQKANKRFLATILHVKLWYEEILTGSDDSWALQSLYNVQGVHFKLVKNYNWTSLKDSARKPAKYDKELWKAVKKDLDASDIPQEFRNWPEHIRNLGSAPPPPLFNQLNLNLFLFMTAGIPILLPERSGIYGATDEEFMGFLHMWAVIGSALGIEDRFNIALHPNLPVAQKHFKGIFEQYLLPSLFEMSSDPDSSMLSENIFKGLIRSGLGDTADETIPVEHMLIMVLEEFFGIPCPNIRSRIPMTHRLLRGFLQYTNTLMGYSSWFREWMNGKVATQMLGDGAQKVFGIDANNPQEIVEKAYA